MCGCKYIPVEEFEQKGLKNKNTRTLDYTSNYTEMYLNLAFILCESWIVSEIKGLLSHMQILKSPESSGRRGFSIALAYAHEI